ncbi:hypothetical protein LCGC14_0252240 [marine sediment metagenome]|uniref:Uncharacterized protein n=1 Tax=marine sediment metagenome TaxID=412755 RepID=A0A0F9UL24_9ZZZZ
MAETSGEALREVADALDGLRDAVISQSREELGRMAQRLRALATAERHLDEGWEGEVGDCDHCGSKLVFRGRNPSVLTCPLGCDETGP